MPPSMSDTVIVEVLRLLTVISVVSSFFGYLCVRALRSVSEDLIEVLGQSMNFDLTDSEVVEDLEYGQGLLPWEEEV